MEKQTNAIDQRFVDLLCCPRDRADLRLEAHGSKDGDQLVCTDCQREYPVRNGVPRFVDTDQYVGNFSHEWTVHRTTQLDSETQCISEPAFAEKTGWRPEDVRGKRVLDVGCGMGRFADVICRWGGDVVGVDLSFAVESAHANLGDKASFYAAQASVFELPFRSESFDLIYSLGVLHHTPDCRKAFECLPSLLRPGGEIAIWVYSSHSYPCEGTEERRDRFYRRFTTLMRPRRLHALCRLLCRVPMRGRAFWHALLPGAIFHAIPRLHDTYRAYQLRVLDTFDWYSPTYQSKHSYPEVCRWFREAGLVDIQPLDFDVSVRARKPASTCPRAAKETECAASSE